MAKNDAEGFSKELLDQLLPRRDPKTVLDSGGLVGDLKNARAERMLNTEVDVTPLRPGAMLFFLCTCVALALSAFYEMIEWWVAVASETGADVFLGNQGDVWDTQWDMFLALCGAIMSQLTLGRLQDWQLRVMRGIV
jgi:putative membrane protein